MKYLINQELDLLLGKRATQEFRQVHNSIRELRYTINDVDVSSRVMSHWAKEGLLFEDFRDKKWRRFDLVSFIWIKCIQQMREFNISVPVIKKIRDSLQQQDVMDYIMNSDDLRSVIIELGKADGQEVPDLESLLSRPEVREEFRKELPNFFKIFLLDVIIIKEHLTILVNRDGEFVMFKESFKKQYMRNPEVRAFLRGSYLSISISGLMMDYCQSNDLNFLADEMHILDKNEVAVLKAIREPGITSVKVRFSSKGDLDLMEITRNQKADRVQRLYEIMLEEGYQDIHLSFQDGRTVYCENTSKIKFSKLGTG